MKKNILYLITFFTVISINHELLSQNRNIEITYKRNSDKSVDISYTKKLPGSYFVKLEFTTLTNCLESSIERVIKSSSGRLVKLNPTNSKENINFSYKYYTIRGIPNPKADSLFNYTLPLMEGNNVKIHEASNFGEQYFGSKKPTNWKSYIVYRNNSDTIYSMRKGIVVAITNKYVADTIFKKGYTSKKNTIIIEHSDGTYASYSGFKKNSIFVKLSQTVYPQTKLGLLEIFNTGKYRLDFSISYLIDNNIENQEKQNLKNRKSKYAYLTPYFLTENGFEKLKHCKKYTVTSNEKTLFKEFTKRERKKYKKNPQTFK